MHEKTEEYKLVYQNRPPYEVLSTKWLPYADVIRLKKIEEMVEVYYNSGQFRNTMEHAEKEFPGAFAMYSALADYYERHDLFRVSHSRMARYEILLRFSAKNIQKCIQTVRRAEGGILPNLLRAGVTEYAEWLTLDLYLRDNMRNRPQFLPESRVSSDEAAAFYKTEEQEHRYLKGY